MLIVLGLLAACGLREQVEPSVGPLVVEFDDTGHFTASNSRLDIELSTPLSTNADAVSDIRAWLQERVDELVQAASDEPGPGYFDDHRYSLSSRWETARSDAIYTFIVRGALDTGGAHPAPFLKTFSYDRDSNRRLGIDDVLAAPESLQEIARLAERHFGKALGDRLFADGLRPEPDNWDNWFVSNNRITFLFPVYQVAPYAEGEQSFPVMVEPATLHLFNLAYFEPWMPALSATDDQGHGPDPGSEEAARSLAWQLLRASSAYQEGGFGLAILSAERGADGVWSLPYVWRHRGDPGSFHSGVVAVNDNSAAFVPDAFRTLSALDIVQRALAEAWQTDRGGALASNFDPDTVVADILDTEHRHAAAFGYLRTVLAIDRPGEMDELWNRLSREGTVADWANTLEAAVVVSGH